MLQVNTLLAAVAVCLIATTTTAHEHAHSHGAEDKEKVEVKHHGEHSQSHKMSGVIIKGQWIRSTAPGAPTTAAYFTLLNETTKDVTLINATSDIAQRVEIHEHSMKDGIMKMQKVNGAVVPKQSSLIFKPGGYHVMFMGLKNSVNEGDKVRITLTFDNGSEKTIEATAKKNANKDKHHHHKHH